MTKTPEGQRQHFVPALLQRNWLINKDDDKESLNVLYKRKHPNPNHWSEGKTILATRSVRIRENMQGRGLWSLSPYVQDRLVIEGKTFLQIDDLSKRVIDKLIERSFLSIYAQDKALFDTKDQEDRSMVCIFMNSIHTRAPDMVGEVRRIGEVEMQRIESKEEFQEEYKKTGSQYSARAHITKNGAHFSDYILMEWGNSVVNSPFNTQLHENIHFTLQVPGLPLPLSDRPLIKIGIDGKLLAVCLALGPRHLHCVLAKNWKKGFPNLRKSTLIQSYRMNAYKFARRCVAFSDPRQLSDAFEFFDPPEVSGIDYGPGTVYGYDKYEHGEDYSLICSG